MVSIRSVTETYCHQSSSVVKSGTNGKTPQIKKKGVISYFPCLFGMQSEFIECYAGIKKKISAAATAHHIRMPYSVYQKQKY